MHEFEEWYAELKRTAMCVGIALDLPRNDWIDTYDAGKSPSEALYAAYPIASPDYNPDLYDKYLTPGSRWMHKNGNVYIVMFVVNNYSTDYRRYPPVVVYRGENGHRWSRPASDWDRSMTPYPWKWYEVGYWYSE